MLRSFRIIVYMRRLIHFLTQLYFLELGSVSRCLFDLSQPNSDINKRLLHYLCAGEWSDNVQPTALTSDMWAAATRIFHIDFHSAIVC